MNIPLLRITPHSVLIALAIGIALLTLVALLIFAGPSAFAQDVPPAAPIDGRVTVPWGDLVATALGVWGVAVTTLAMKALQFLPQQWRVDTLARAAIQYGINNTRDAVAGKTFSVEVGSNVIERALEYWLARAPDLLRKVGGESAARAILLSRVSLEADAVLSATAIPSPPRGGAVGRV
jgi:hypothetical protein